MWLKYRAEWLPGFISSWSFFVVPFLALALVLGFCEKLGGREKADIPWLPVFFSLLFTLALMALSNFNYVRYAFPTIWAAVLLLFVPISKITAPWAKGILILIFLAIASSCYFPAESKMNLWPKRFGDEYYRSGGTTFAGFPFFRWTLTAKATDGLCLLVPENQGEMNYYVENFLHVFIRNLKVFGENQIQDFNACQNPKGIYYRQYGNRETVCATACPEDTAVQTCTAQPIAFFSVNGYSADNPGTLFNRICLP